MRLAATTAAMTPSPVQPPFPAVPARPGVGAAGDATSPAASVFALLLAGVLPMPIAGLLPMPIAGLLPVPTPAAAAAPLGASDGLLAGGTRSPDAGPADGHAIPAAGQSLAPQTPAGPPAPANGGPALDRPTALPGRPALADADRAAGPAPDALRPGTAVPQPAAAGRAAPVSALPDADQPARPAAPVAAIADDELAERASAGPQLLSAGAADGPAHETATRIPGQRRIAVAAAPTGGDRPVSAAVASSSAALAPAAEPDPEPQPTPPAAASDPGAEPAAPRPRLTAAAAAPTPPAAARIDPTAEFAEAATGRSERAASEPPSPASRATPQAPVVQIAIQIAGAAARHVERLVVQLEPPALGRVEVRLDFSHDNRVTALIAVDRPETLELLQRDSRALERGLQDAGLRLDQDALSFSLRQEQRGQERGAGLPGPWQHLEPATGSAEQAEPAADARPVQWLGAHRVLDIRI